MGNLTYLSRAEFDVRDARAAAQAKHGTNSIEAIDPRSSQWLPILMEEVGELAHELTYDGIGRLRSELVDIASVVLAWIDAIDNNCNCPKDQHAYTGCLLNGAPPI